MVVPILPLPVTVPVIVNPLPLVKVTEVLAIIPVRVTIVPLIFPVAVTLAPAPVPDPVTATDTFPPGVPPGLNKTFHKPVSGTRTAGVGVAGTEKGLTGTEIWRVQPKKIAVPPIKEIINPITTKRQDFMDQPPGTIFII
jgi:hypothetical protein